MAVVLSAIVLLSFLAGGGGGRAEAASVRVLAATPDPPAQILNEARLSRPAGDTGSDGCVATVSSGQGCASLIRSGKYCLSSYGSRTGPARQEFCLPNDDNELWYLVRAGAHHRWELYNVGDSCAPGARFGSPRCGTPFKSVSGYGHGFCIAVRGEMVHPNTELRLRSCANGRGTGTDNTGFLNPMTFTPVGYGPDGTVFLKYSDSGQDSSPLFISTRGQSRPGSPYVLQEPNRGNERSLELTGATITSAPGVHLTSAVPSPLRVPDAGS